jgi:hypothetical protein
MLSPSILYHIGTKGLPLGTISSPAFPLPPFSSPKCPKNGGRVFPIPHFGETFSPPQIRTPNLSADLLGVFTMYELNARLLLVPFPQIDPVLAGLDFNLTIAVLKLVSVEN